MFDTIQVIIDGKGGGGLIAVALAVNIFRSCKYGLLTFSPIEETATLKKHPKISTELS